VSQATKYVPVFAASGADDQLVQVPDVIRTQLFAAEAPGIVWPELLATGGSFRRTRRAAREQNLLHERRTQQESKIEPNGMSDDLGWAALASAADVLIMSAHPHASLSLSVYCGKTTIFAFE